jgi:hypothetical protein
MAALQALFKETAQRAAFGSPGLVLGNNLEEQMRELEAVFEVLGQQPCAGSPSVT